VIRLITLIVAMGFALSRGSLPVRGQTHPATTGTATVAFLDVGQGDSILFRSPEGKTVLIDAGPSKDVVPLLRSRGVRSIDMVVVTHHHADHYGGMQAVSSTPGSSSPPTPHTPPSITSGSSDWFVTAARLLSFRQTPSAKSGWGRSP